MILVIF